MKRLLALLPAALAIGSAQAGLFDDEEARRRVAELKTAVEARQDADARALLDLGNQLQALRDEQARLRGQLETVTNGIEQINKRLQDFYVDLDNRLRKLEPQSAAPAAPAKVPGGEAVADENKEYDAALNLLKAAKFKEAATALTAFTTNNPNSPLAPSAQFWLGKAWYGMRDCKRTIEVHQQLLAKWPTNPRAADALLSIATCQQEQGKAALARKSLEEIVERFPESPAADTARQSLKKK